MTLHQMLPSMLICCRSHRQSRSHCDAEFSSLAAFAAGISDMPANTGDVVALDACGTDEFNCMD